MPRAVLKNEIELEYQLLGEGPDSAIVLIRGAGTQLIHWPSSLLQSLVDYGYKIVVFDNRDAGLSSKCSDQYSLSDMCDDVIYLMDALNSPRAHIFGIAMGGAIAQLVAIEHPERVKTLTGALATSGDPNIPPPPKDLIDLMMSKADGREAQIAKRARLMSILGGHDAPDSVADITALESRAFDRCYAPDGAKRQLIAAISDGSRVDRLKSISVPTLVIQGKADPLVPIEAGRSIAQSVPGSRLEVIEGMGHSIPASLGPTIAQLLHKHIKQGERSSA